MSTYDSETVHAIALALGYENTRTEYALGTRYAYYVRGDRTVRIASRHRQAGPGDYLTDIGFTLSPAGRGMAGTWHNERGTTAKDGTRLTYVVLGWLASPDLEQLGDGIAAYKHAKGR